MKKIIIPALSVLLLQSALAQNIGINSTGANPVNSAMLDIVSSNSGLLIPRVALTATNAAGPIAAPATSLLVYNTASAGAGATAVTPGFYYWDSSAWQRFDVGNNVGDWKILGNANTVSGTNFLGTTNGQALDFRTNNSVRFQIANGNQVYAMSNGTAALPFYSWNADTDIGMFRRTTNELNFSTAATEALRITPTQRLQGVDGSNAAPTFSFINDPNTGMYSAAGDQINWSTNGVERLRLTNTQLATTFTGSSATPAYSFTGDPNTGIFSPAADNFSVTTGGTETMRSNTTRMDVMQEIRTRQTDAVSGDVLVHIHDNAADDGVIDIYNNNNLNHTFHGNGTSVYNELGLDLDFRFETNTNTNAMLIDAGNDVVRIGSGTGSLTQNGTNITPFWGGSYTVDYVADFDNGATTATAIGFGSIEFMMDGSNEVFFTNCDFSPGNHGLYDIGWSNEWRDLYLTGNVFSASDMRLKENVEPLKYGLNELLQLNPIEYEYISDEFNTRHLGLSAQELLPLIGESVKTHTFKKLTEDSEVFEKVELERMKVSYMSLIPVLIQALKEEDTKVESLKKRIQELEKVILEMNK